MHYKLKSFGLRGKLSMTLAPSNLRPLRYEKSHYRDGDFREQCEKFADDLLTGCIQPLGSCNHKDWLKAVDDVKRMLKHTSLELDFKFHVDRLNLVYEVIAKKYLVPLLLKEAFDANAVLEEIRELDAESAVAYRQKQEEYDSKGIITIRSAWRCEWLNEAVILVDYDGNWYLARRDRYDNRGLLENSSADAVRLNLPSEALHALCYGENDRAVIDKIPWASFLQAGFFLKTYPYPDFQIGE